LHDRVNAQLHDAWAQRSRSTNVEGVTLGAEVRRRRKARGWTLEQLAERADLTAHYLSTLETGGRDPSVSTVQQLAKALGCAPGELLGGVPGISPAAFETARLFDAAPAEVQEGVAKILKATAKKRK
jgi:transcriptional regulator with XRE-family HTH domain